MPGNLPLGTKNHQQILETIQSFYGKDERVLQVLLFGSLSRGNWDQYSDIDLDIIFADTATIDANRELIKLCVEIQNKHGLEAIIIANSEEGDVVLSNLVEFSIRYHILSDTKPAILDSMRSLVGSLSLDNIRASANYAHNAKQKDHATIVNEYIRYTVGLHHAIMRQRLWMSMELLHRIRAALMQLYAVSHNEVRAIHLFDLHADSNLQRLLSSLTATADLTSMEKAFNTALFLLENHLDSFCEGAYQLSSTQKIVVDALKQLSMDRES